MQEGEEDCARSGSRREREGDRKTKRGRAREGETERDSQREKMKHARLNFQMRKPCSYSASAHQLRMRARRIGPAPHGQRTCARSEPHSYRERMLPYQHRPKTEWADIHGLHSCKFCFLRMAQCAISCWLLRTLRRV